MIRAPLAREENFDWTGQLEEENRDGYGNNEWDGSYDCIPYSSIYDSKEEIRIRGYFIPGSPVNASITKVERDWSGRFHLVNRYVYTIELKHGPFQWTIYRHYSDFQRLNAALSFYRAITSITSPFLDIGRNEEDVLYYTDGGQLIEPETGAACFDNDNRNRKYSRSRRIRTDKVDAQMEMETNANGNRDQPSMKRRQKAKRKQVRRTSVPDFPDLPEMFLSERKLEERRADLERYLRELLKIDAYRNHAETARFLEVSRLSFLEDLRPKSKEGIIEKRPMGWSWLGRFRNFCFAYCMNWKDTWLAIKESYVANLDHRTELILDVILFDQHFDVFTAFDYPGQSVRKGLFVTNGNRYMTLKCDSVEEGNQWKYQIENSQLGSIWCDQQRFGSTFPPREGVYAQWLVDGRSYMEHVADVMQFAQQEIFIADWCLHPKIYIKRPISGDDWRLDLILKRKADEGVKVFVLLYKEFSSGLPSIASYETEQYLTSLSPNIKVLRHPDIRSSFVFWWSHHEKLIVVDQNIAFVGGIDLCYGRWDDHKHRLVDLGTDKRDISTDQVDSKDELFLRMKESYERQLLQHMDTGQSSDRRVKFDDSPIQEKRPMTVSDVLNIKYNRIGSKAAAARTTEVEVHFNESGRLWPGKDYMNLLLKDIDHPERPFEDDIDRTIIPRMPWHDIGCVLYGSISRDVARHFIQRWNETKAELLEEVDATFPCLLPKSYDGVQVADVFQDMSIPCNAQVLRSCSPWSAGRASTEFSIQTAYVKLIEEAKYYIYIENQFFISNTAGDPAKNEIAGALYRRILRAHENKETFRVYVVMPLLPGYPKTSGAMQMELHYTYLTISKGPQSLLERLKTNVGDPSQYISFYGLRTHGELLGRLVTELIYVHSKIMIVDDRRCVIGSANINDRSQIGDRDSEVVVLIEDIHFHPSSTDSGIEVESGAFAGSLRRRIFQEHLGLSMEATEADDNGNDATNPMSPEFHQLWNSIAEKNTEIYEQVFDCTPGDHVSTIDQWAYKEQNTDALADTDKEKAQKLLEGIQGHLVLFPTQFLSQSDLLLDAITVEAFVPGYVFT